MKSSFLRATVAIAAVAAFQTAAAQESAAAPGASPAENTADTADETVGSDVIVVTARKRAESVQDVPISIAVTSGETLQREGISDLDGLKNVTSGLTMRRSANQITVPTLRGLGTGTSSETFEQSIAGFLDGTYIGRSSEMNAGIFDLERVEIIKGTQAALLAKNTSLGAISMISRKPRDKFEFNLSAGKDLSLGGYTVDGGVSVPISDTFGIRVSGLLRRQDGWVRNTITGADNPETRSVAGRIVAVWQPTDNLDATFLFQSFETKTNGNAVEFVADVLGNARARALAAGNPDFEANLDRLNSATNGPFSETDRTHGNRLVGTLNYDTGGVTLTSVSSYSDFDQLVVGDKDFNTGLYLNQTTTLANKQYSQELRLTSPSNQPFSYILGLYFQNEKFTYTRATIAETIVPNGSFSDAVKLDTDTFSAFGSANYEFGGGFSANVGLRLTHEKRDGFFPARIYTVPGSISALYPAYDAEARRIKGTDLDGSVGIQYKPSSTVLLFASASKGTKGGTFLSAPTRPSTSLIPAEKAETFEGGAKITLDRGFLNVTGFHTKITNLQQATFNGSIFINDPRDVRSYGFEVDASYRLIDDIRAFGSVTYAHARNIADAAHPGDDSRVINAPTWSGRAGLAYDGDIGSDFRLTASADVEFRSKVLFAPESATAGYGTNPNVAVVPVGESFGKINARLGFGSADERWEVALVGRNLTDRLTLGYAIPATFQSGAAVGAADMPRTVMLQFNLKY